VQNDVSSKNNIFILCFNDNNTININKGMICILIASMSTHVSNTMFLS